MPVDIKLTKMAMRDSATGNLLESQLLALNEEMADVKNEFNNIVNKSAIQIQDAAAEASMDLLSEPALNNILLKTNDILDISNMANSGYIAYNSSSSFVNMTPQINSSFQYIIYDVTEGDKFTVSLRSGGAAQAIMFVDTSPSGNARRIANTTLDNNVDLENFVVTTPHLANKIIIQGHVPNESEENPAKWFVYKGEFCVNKINNLQTQINLSKYRYRTISWKGTTDNTAPYGWRNGYYPFNENQTTSRANSDIAMTPYYAISVANYPELADAKYIRITPRHGYQISIIKRDSNNLCIQQYGGWGSWGAPQYINQSITVEFDPSCNYIVNLGRFFCPSNDPVEPTSEILNPTPATPSSINDPTFGLAVIFEAYYEFDKIPYGKSSGTIFFTVDVERPLTIEENEQSTTTESVECVLRLPDTYKAIGTPTRLIFACHGAGAYIASPSVWGNVNWNSFMNALLTAGYAVFDCNTLPTSVGTNIAGYGVGSPYAINVARKAYDYIQENYNVYPEIFVHGTSMGGATATAFSHIYPQLVLAESSFAGRDITQYIYLLKHKIVDDNSDNDADLDRMAQCYGYIGDTAGDSSTPALDALIQDKWSTIEGVSPSLGIIKYENGIATFPPDRESDFNNWLIYYSDIQTQDKNDAIGKYSMVKEVPYKTWESWDDNANRTKVKFIFQEGVKNNNAMPYYVVAYDNISHTNMSYGLYNNMVNQLISWYKRWE